MTTDLRAASTSQPAPSKWSVTDATRAVARALAPSHRVGIAYSGGVDSTVLLALTGRAIGADNTLAIIAASESLPADELSAAADIARQLGITTVQIQTREIDRAEYRRNGPDRCYFCKDELFSRIDSDLIGAHRLDAVAYGENADDVRRTDRPGARAATKHRVLRPLAQLGLTKSDVRHLARQLGLPNAAKPAAPCLASRIPHFQDVTTRKLGQIERAEKALQGMGFAELRVRHHGTLARIELPTGDLERALTDPIRTAIIDAVRQCGFDTVTIDRKGMQSGAFTLSIRDVGNGHQTP